MLHSQTETSLVCGLRRAISDESADDQQTRPFLTLRPPPVVCFGAVVKPESINWTLISLEEMIAPHGADVQLLQDSLSAHAAHLQPNGGASPPTLQVVSRLVGPAVSCSATLLRRSSLDLLSSFQHL